MEYEIAQKLCFWFRNDAFHPNLYIFNQKFDFFLQNPYSSEINPDFFTLSNIGKSPICSTLTFNIFFDDTFQLAWHMPHVWRHKWRKMIYGICFRK